MRKTTFAIQPCLHGFPLLLIQILVISKFSKLSWIGAHVSCLFVTGKFDPLSAWGKVKWQFKNFRIYKHLSGKPCKCDWVAKFVFLIHCINASNFCWPLQSLLLRYTTEWLKILRSPNFNMLFQLVLKKIFKSELFSYLLKVDHVIKSRKEPIGHWVFRHMELTYCNDLL